MTENKFENEKFTLNFKFNEKLQKFESINYIAKKLNKLENEILKEACLLIPKNSIYELYEHLIIRVENKLRDFTKTNYSGVLFPENVSDEYKYFLSFFRKFLKPFIKNNLHKTINFQAIEPKKDWVLLSEEKKKEKIYGFFNQYIKSEFNINFEIKIVKIHNNVDIYIELPTITDVNFKNDLCLKLEIFLKRNLDESLNIYLKTVWDKNKLRRLNL